MPDGIGLSSAAGVCAGDGDRPIHVAVSLSRHTEVGGFDEHGDDEGVAMKCCTPGVCGRSRTVARGTRQRGAVLIEQALILPILVALFFGAVDMARAMYSYAYVSYIAREATRWASVRSTATALNGPAATNGLVKTFVSNTAGMGLDPARFSTNTTFLPPANGSPLCPGGPVNEKPGCVVQVTVNYNFKFFMLSTTPLVMSSTSQMTITQ